MRNRVVVLALILILIAHGGYAAGPSSTMGNLYTVEVTNTDGTPVPDGLDIITVPETKTTLAILEQTGTDALELRELAGLLAPGYTEDMGDLRGRFAFPTRFGGGMPLVARVGLVAGERINWVTLADAANEDGNVVVTLPREILGQIRGDNAVFAVYYYIGAYAAVETGDLME